MSEMVDRIVKAMQEIAGEEELNEVKAEALARAAIEVMREPTEAMKNAGDMGSHYMSPDHADQCWKQMIDAALNAPLRP
jgi:hypothetical protein